MTDNLIDDFNAIIEGTYADEWRRHNLKITLLDIPKNTISLNDETYMYHLYGRTEDFKSIQRGVLEDGSSERDIVRKNIESLSWCPGIVLPYRGGIPNILERPRAVFMEDGRIFVEGNMVKDGLYLESLNKLVLQAGEIFGHKAEILRHLNGTHQRLVA